VKRAVPLHYIWWLVSRASGIVAVVLISLSVLMGLAMATRVLRRPGLKRTVARLHQQLALVSLFAIGAHGLALLGDQWLKPGWRGIAVPFALGYRPQYTGLGIIAGYLAVLLGPSFYLRKRVGARRWRKLHRATVIVWILAVLHTIGAGSDAKKLWLQAVVLAPGVPIIYLLMLRLLSAGASRPPHPLRVTATPEVLTASRQILGHTIREKPQHRFGLHRLPGHPPGSSLKQRKHEEVRNARHRR
jgi:methionine sulfoxide reductase heme-binding subunit